MKSNLLIAIFSFTLVVNLPPAPTFAQQAEAAVEIVDAAQPQEEKTADTDKPETESGPITDTAKTNTPTETIGAQTVRLHMWDGSIVGGELQVNAIDMVTEFGTLQIPISKIVKFHPGLNSIPALNKKIDTLVEGLGDKDFDVRENSHKELVAMGLELRNEIHNFDDGGSAERKKHLAEIKKQIEEMTDDLDEFEVADNDRPLIRGDVVVTDQFTIVGKIQQDQFQLASKFGTLSVKLGDIKMGDRAFNLAKSEVRKTIEIGAMAFFQTKPVSTRIRVNRGDKISIRATGIVKWTNWSTQSGPDGLENQGQWQGVNSGTLMARIGNGNDYIAIGTDEEFVAKQSGVLFLGIAIQDNYTRNNGYRWEGEYSAKVVVQPAE